MALKSREHNSVPQLVADAYSQRVDGEEYMARKTVLVCDNCGMEVEDGRGAVMRVTFTDARRGAKAADLCDGCAGTMPGNAVARRGRKPKSAA